LSTIFSECNNVLTELIFTEKEVIKILTQVAVTKREQEINLDEQDFGEKKRINKRKKLIEKGMSPEEADREIEADLEWKRRKGDKSSNSKRSKISKKSDLAEASTSSATNILV
jgi:ATP-dependent RNA helicase DDX49/DBP8